MFEVLHSSFDKIVSCIGIIGYKEEEITKRGLNTSKNLPFTCLYSYPNKKQPWLSPLTYQMMFPDNNHKIPCPKFFALTLTNQSGGHSYLYCLKFSEKYILSYEEDKYEEIEIPIVIFIKSEKEDLESFKQLMNIINFIIVNDEIDYYGDLSNEKINDYKKVQLINIFFFIFSLPHSPPHSLIKLKLSKEIKNPPTEVIDFYFSSNCEIPCNKNDTDINILFLLLDQSIIIKVLFSILTEKQIVFRASQAYLLHIIIPCFLKLIFPFKFINNYITVLPKENLGLLEVPGPSIFGVLSSIISLKDLMMEYPGKIIVDCDTNEIYGDTNLEPFVPPKKSISTLSSKNIKKEKNKNKENTNTLVNNGNFLTQGNNVFNINGSYLYKYENDINNKKYKFAFDNNKNNIIIDTKKSQLLVDKTNIFIDSNEWKWLRKNIQLVRNPEIFDLDNISNKKKSSNNNGIYLSEEDEENVVLPNRPFSYNIQNIFMKYILNKLSFTESEFMTVFKNTNLYLNYNQTLKYQNNSGKKIIENILELKNKQRNIENSFNIEYTLPKFKVNIIISKIEEKLKDEINDGPEYQNIKTILDNYIKVISEEENEKEEYEIYEGLPGLLKNDHILTGERKSDIKKLNRLTKVFRRGHERIKTSVLQESFSGDNKFLLLGANNSNKSPFKFYKEKGFLEFIYNFEKILNQENLNIMDELYQGKIDEQILDFILGNQDLFISNKNDKKYDVNNAIKNENKFNIKSYKKKDTFSEKEKKNKTAMTPIMENATEEEDNDIILEGIEGRETVIQNNNADEFDFAGNMNKIMDDINGYDPKKISEEEDIISFPNFNINNKENEENIEDNINLINQELDEKINHKMQYYLFIASNIEGMISDKEKSEKFIKKINQKKDINITLNSLLLKLYRLAFKYSGAKHRDFPYFSYYNFLMKLDLEELKLLQEDFNDLTDAEIGIFEIYGNANLEKEKELQKKTKIKNRNLEKQKQKEMELEKKNLSESKKDKNQEQKNEFKIRRSQKLTKKDWSEIDKLIIKESEKKDPNQFDISTEYIININQDFECENENPNINLIQNIATELTNLISNIKDIKTKSDQNIIEEMNKNILENKTIFKLIGQLKYVNIKTMNLFKPRMCFWLNCFDYLILFTIFYKKWDLKSEKDWKFFLKNVKFNINGDLFSFNDMEYFIYKKVLFFPSSYIINENLKPLRVHKAEDAKSFERKYPLIYNPFILYLPIQGFIKPVIYEENKLEIQINKRISDYFLKFIKIDYEKNIYYSSLLINYFPNFLNKDLKKFQTYIIPLIYNFIKDKKYRSAIQNNMEWKMDLEAFTDDKDWKKELNL